MRYGSLFSGIGGFDLGFERAGMECAWQCEIDKHAQNVLRTHFGKEIYNDVRTIGRDTEPVDLICGGFPCQDVSIAGRRAGLAGERSGLWFEFARIVKELKPGWVVIENVPGLLSSNGGRDFAVILQELVKLRYGVCWRVLDAQFFGVPQRRRRVFIVASLGNGNSAKVLFESEGLRGNPPTRSQAGEETSRIAGTLSANGGGLDRPAGNANELDFCVPMLSGTLSSTQHGKTQQNNELDFLIARSQTSSNQRQDFETENFVINLANSGANQNNVKAAKVSDTVDTWATQAIAYKIRGGKAGGGKGFLGSEKTPFSLTGFNDQYFGVRRLTPTECERLQGFPDGWTEGQADTQRYKQLGNAIAVPVAEWIGRRIVAVV